MNFRNCIVFVVFICVFLSSPRAQSQNMENHSYGFVRLVDAVFKGNGNLSVLLNGKSLRKEGYPLGAITGKITLPPASYEFSLVRDGIGKGSAQVEVKKDETVILIAFPEQISTSHAEPERWRIHVLKLKAYDASDQQNVTLVSVCRKPEIKIEFLQMGEIHSAIVKRFSPERIVISQPKGHVPISFENKKLCDLSVAAIGNHVVVIYEDENGGICAKSFLDS